MPISPRAPQLGPVNFDYPHGDNFIEPVHLIKRGGPPVDQGMVPEAEIDASYDRDKILAAEPTPKVRPIFLGMRKALAARRVERANNRIEELAAKEQVLRYVGKSILANDTYTDPKVGGQPNQNRPSTSDELRAVKKLDKINIKRRRAGSRVHSTYHNLTPPARATRSESKHAAKRRGQHDRATARLSEHDEQFRTVITQPAREAERLIARRNRAVARQEALDQAAEWRADKTRQIRDDIQASAIALGQEIAEQHQESWDLTKEQAERLAAASVKVGHLVVSETVATAQFAAKGSRHTAAFYSEIARDAADFYWSAGKHMARKATGRSNEAELAAEAEDKADRQEQEQSLED